MVSGVVHVMHNGRWFVGRVVTEVLGHHGLFEVSFVNPDPADGRRLGAIFRPDEIKEGLVVVSELAGALKYDGDPVLRENEWSSDYWSAPVGGKNLELMVEHIRYKYRHGGMDIVLEELNKHARAAGVDVPVTA